MDGIRISVSDNKFKRILRRGWRTARGIQGDASRQLSGMSQRIPARSDIRISAQIRTRELLKVAAEKKAIVREGMARAKHVSYVKVKAAQLKMMDSLSRSEIFKRNFPDHTVEFYLSANQNTLWTYHERALAVLSIQKGGSIPDDLKSDGVDVYLFLFPQVKIPKEIEHTYARYLFETQRNIYVNIINNSHLFQANSLNEERAPSITGIEADAPILPSSKTTFDCLIRLIETQQGFHIAKYLLKNDLNPFSIEQKIELYQLMHRNIPECSYSSRISINNKTQLKSEISQKIKDLKLIQVRDDLKRSLLKFSDKPWILKLLGVDKIDIDTVNDIEWLKGVVEKRCEVIQDDRIEAIQEIFELSLNTQLDKLEDNQRLNIDGTITLIDDLSTRSSSDQYKSMLQKLKYRLLVFKERVNLNSKKELLDEFSLDEMKLMGLDKLPLLDAKLSVIESSLDFKDLIYLKEMNRRLDESTVDSVKGVSQLNFHTKDPVLEDVKNLVVSWSKTSPSAVDAKYFNQLSRAIEANEVWRILYETGPNIEMFLKILEPVHKKLVEHKRYNLVDLSNFELQGNGYDSITLFPIFKSVYDKFNMLIRQFEQSPLSLTDFEIDFLKASQHFFAFVNEGDEKYTEMMNLVREFIGFGNHPEGSTDKDRDTLRADLVYLMLPVVHLLSPNHQKEVLDQIFRSFLEKLKESLGDSVDRNFSQQLQLIFMNCTIEDKVTLLELLDFSDQSLTNLKYSVDERNDVKRIQMVELMVIEGRGAIAQQVVKRLSNGRLITPIFGFFLNYVIDQEIEKNKTAHQLSLSSPLLTPSIRQNAFVSLSAMLEYFKTFSNWHLSESDVIDCVRKCIEQKYYCGANQLIPLIKNKESLENILDEYLPMLYSEGKIDIAASLVCKLSFSESLDKYCVQVLRNLIERDDFSEGNQSQITFLFKALSRDKKVSLLGEILRIKDSNKRLFMMKLLDKFLKDYETRAYNAANRELNRIEGIYFNERECSLCYEHYIQRNGGTITKDEFRKTIYSKYVRDKTKETFESLYSCSFGGRLFPEYKIYFEHQEFEEKFDDIAAEFIDAFFENEEHGITPEQMREFSQSLNGKLLKGLERGFRCFSRKTISNNTDNIKEKEILSILGFPDGRKLKDIRRDELKKAFRKASLALHPDKNGGDPEKTAKFVTLSAVKDHWI